MLVHISNWYFHWSTDTPLVHRQRQLFLMRAAADTPTCGGVGGGGGPQWARRPARTAGSNRGQRPRGRRGALLDAPRAGCEARLPTCPAQRRPTCQALAGAAGQHNDAAARAPVAKHFGQRLLLVRPVLRQGQGAAMRGAWNAACRLVRAPGDACRRRQTSKQILSPGDTGRCSRMRGSPLHRPRRRVGLPGGAEPRAACVRRACTFGFRSMARSGLCESFLKSYSSSIG